MNLPLRQALPLALLSASLCATSPAIALDRLCFLAGINFRPPAKAVRDQELKWLTAEVEKVKDDIATNSEHLDYWWELTGAQKCLPFGKADASAMYQHIGENISIFARAERRLKTELDTKKAALDDFLTTFSKIIQAEADNADNMDKCIAAAKAAPSAAAVSGEDKPAGPFSVELAINGQGCTATPNHNCLKEFDLKRGKDAPTPPLTLVGKMSGFYLSGYWPPSSWREQSQRVYRRLL